MKGNTRREVERSGMHKHRIRREDRLLIVVA